MEEDDCPEDIDVVNVLDVVDVVNLDVDSVVDGPDHDDVELYGVDVQ